MNGKNNQQTSSAEFAKHDAKTIKYKAAKQAKAAVRDKMKHDDLFTYVMRNDAGTAAWYEGNAGINETDHILRGFGRYEHRTPTGRFSRDTAGSMSAKGATVLTGALFLTSLIGAGYFKNASDNAAKEIKALNDKNNAQNKTINSLNENLTVYKNNAQPEQNYTKKNGKLYDRNGQELNLSKAPKKYLYTANQMRNPVVKDNTPTVKVNDDNSVLSEVGQKDGSGSTNASNIVDSNVLMKNILPSMVPNPGVNFGVYQPLGEKDTQVVYKLDEAAKASIRSNGNINVPENATGFKFGYDKDLKPISQWVMKDGRNITIDSTSGKIVRNYLADNDADENAGIMVQDAQLYDHQVKEIRKDYDSYVAKENSFLGQYHFKDLSDAGKVLNKTRDLLVKYKQGGLSEANLSKLGDMIESLRMTEKEKNDFWHNLTVEYNITNESQLNSMFANFSKLSNKWNALWQNMTKKYGASDEPTLVGVIDGMNATKNKWNAFWGNVSRDYNVTNESQLYNLVAAKDNEIANDEAIMAALENQIEMLGRPYTTEKITKDCDTTGHCEQKETDAGEAGLPVYHLNLTDSAQDAIVQGMFDSNLTDIWDLKNVTELHLVDAIDVDNESATVEAYDVNGTLRGVYTIDKDTWHANEAKLKPYRVKFD